MPDFKEGRRLLFDVESDGLLPTLTKLHCLVIKDVDTKQIWKFRRNKKMDNIAEGVAMLQRSGMLIGHNIIGFDIKAIQIVFPDFSTEGIEIRDTLVIVRLLPLDFKKLDFAANKQGRLPGKFIGKHSLDSWGYRLGKRKGDYMADMVDKGLDPWAEWNPDMEDYCENDVEVNFLLWEMIETFQVNLDTIDMEQATQEVVTYMEHIGFPFKVAEAKKLAEGLQKQFDALVAKVSEGRRGKHVADKKYVVGPLWDDPDGKQAAKVKLKPREEFGEDYSRRWWGDITIPKKTTKSSDPAKRGDRTEGAAYCKLKWVPFKSTSRDQVVSVLIDDYGWEPTEWTETGKPSVGDTVLRAFGEHHEECIDFANIFRIQKLLGYMVNGAEAWVKKYNEETGSVHCYINIGGTVTGRASHHGPNLGQVPSVQTEEDDEGIDQIVYGIAGKCGYECRALFGADTLLTPSLKKKYGGKRVPDLITEMPADFANTFVQCGVDLSGIEFRMLAERMAEHDGGELIEVIASGQDIHAYNMKKTGISSRSIIKRGLYGLLYGAGDPKIGATIAANLDPNKWPEAGRLFRAQLMEGIPALKKVIDAVQAQAEQGFIYGLDGRKVFCRSSHSALNTQLQGDAALIAKRWLVFTEDAALSAGMNHGWAGEFAMLAFVHDEIQTAVRARKAKEYAALCIEAAAQAGESFDMACPIDAEAKLGWNWSDCH